MSKESISGKIKTILGPEKEVEDLQKKREEAKGIFFSQKEIDEPSPETVKAIEELLNLVKERRALLANPPNPEANNRRFGPK